MDISYKLIKTDNILQERTNRLNQQYAENEENINAKFNKKELNENNDSSLEMSILVKDLEQQLESNLKIKSQYEEKINQYQEDMAILFDLNKERSNQIDDLKESLRALEANNNIKSNEIESWNQEKEDLRLEKIDIQNNLNEYMTKVSDLKIYIENIEFEFKRKITDCEEKLISSEHLNEERTLLIDELIDKYNELKVNIFKIIPKLPQTIKNGKKSKKDNEFYLAFK